MKVSCDYCKWQGDEDELIVIDDIEYCPNCQNHGYLMLMLEYICENCGWEGHSDDLSALYCCPNCQELSLVEVED